MFATNFYEIDSINQTDTICASKTKSNRFTQKQKSKKRSIKRSVKFPIILKIPFNIIHSVPVISMSLLRLERNREEKKTLFKNDHHGNCKMKV